MKLSEIDPDLSAQVPPYPLSCAAESIERAAATTCPLPLASNSSAATPCSLPPAPCPPRLLVIAYGNSLRRDDGAGIGLASILVKQWRACGLKVRYVVVPQLTPELTVEIADPTVMGVVFVDTAQAELLPTIKMQAIQLDLATPSISHYLDPAGLLLYAHLLEDYARAAWVVSVPGVDFGYGEGFSQPVRALLCDAPQLALEFLAQIQERLREQVQYA